MSRTRRTAGGAAVVPAFTAAAWAAAPGSRLLEIYPREGMVKPGESVHLEVRVERA